jgi:hypothetical protein
LPYAEQEPVVVEEISLEYEEAKAEQRGQPTLTSKSTRLTDLLEHLEASFKLSSEADEAVWVVSTTNNEISMPHQRAKGRSYRFHQETLDYELASIEKASPLPSKNYSKSFKVVQRKAANANLMASGWSPVRREADVPQVQPVDERCEAALYAEVLMTAYALGGDSFVLHSGDIVEILQFLPDYGMAEVRWEGQQGLVSITKLHVKARANQSPSKPLRLTRRDADAFAKASLSSRKMLQRLQEQHNAEKIYS